jgi:hypothetical protein
MNNNINNTAMKWMMAGALGIFVANVSPADAQSTLGGAKPQQNKLGGVAKPAPAIGGAAVHTPSPPTPPKPGPVAGLAKPTSPGTVTPGATGATPSGLNAGNTRPNPPVTPPSKSAAVVTSNLKCGSGACTSKGPKP